MRHITIFVLSALISILLLSCSQGSKDTEIREGQLTILYSGNIGGKTDMCGCRHQKGGLSRRATVIDSIRNEAPNMLVLDSGAMLYPYSFLYPPFDHTARLAAHLISDSVNEIGIDAINVSSYDLAQGADTLMTFDRNSPVTWMSANFVHRKTNEPVFASDRILTAGNLRVGVFGLMSPTSMGVDIYNEDDPYAILSPLETAKKEVSALKDKCDIIVALVYMDLEDVKALSEEVSGISVIIQSHTLAHQPSSNHDPFLPVEVNDTIICRCPDGGQVIGRINLSIVDGSFTFKDLTQMKKLLPPAAFEKASTESNYIYSFCDLVKEITPNQIIEKKIQDLVEYKMAYSDSIGSDVP